MADQIDQLIREWSLIVNLLSRSLAPNDILRYFGTREQLKHDLFSAMGSRERGRGGGGSSGTLPLISKKCKAP